MEGFVIVVQARLSGNSTVITDSSRSKHFCHVLDKSFVICSVGREPSAHLVRSTASEPGREHTPSIIAPSLHSRQGLHRGLVHHFIPCQVPSLGTLFAYTSIFAAGLGAESARCYVPADLSRKSAPLRLSRAICVTHRSCVCEKYDQESI